MALTLSELRERLETGLIEDSQLIWNPSAEMWTPVHMVSWLKRTTAIEIPPKPVKSTQNSTSLTTTTILSKEPLPSLSHPKIAYPVKKGSKTPTGKPIMVYPPKRKFPILKTISDFIEDCYYVIYRARKRGLQAAFLMVCLAIVLIETNAWMIKRGLQPFSVQFLTQNSKTLQVAPLKVTEHYQLILKNVPNLIITLDDSAANLSGSKLADYLTKISAEMPDAPDSNELFGHVEVQFPNQQKYIIDGPAWKELSIFKDMAVEQRMLILSRYIASMRTEITKL